MSSRERTTEGKRPRRRGHVRQRGRTWTAYWSAPDENGRARQRSKGGFKTAAAAERHLTKTIRDLDTGNYAEPETGKRKQPFAQYLRDDYLPHLEKMGRRPSTLASYRSNLELHVIPTLGTLRLAAITPEKLDGLYGELLASGNRKGGGGLSPRSVRYVHTIVRASLAQAVQWDRIARNPADRATPPKSERYQASTWTPEQLRTFLDRSVDHRLSPAWLLLATTGMRRGEVLGLRWCDLDLDGGGLQVEQTVVAVAYKVSFSTPKTPKSRRRVALDPHTIAALRSHRARQSEEKLAAGGAYTDHDLVFADEIGQPVHPETLSRTFTRRSTTAGLPTIRLHDLRHSFATAALEAGVPLKVVSDRLGHSTIAITGDTYSHVRTGLDEDAAARVAAAILG